MHETNRKFRHTGKKLLATADDDSYTKKGPHP